MTLAINLAQALNCDGEEKPCGECHHCQRISAGKHADVQVVGLSSDGSSHRTEIGIDQIKNICRSSHLPPYEGRHRVFIIDGAEHLSAEAANSLLKTLEEPPPKVMFVLLATNERLLLPTILSRCQRVELCPLPLSTTEEALVHRFRASPEEARFLARLSAGRLGWAVSALNDKRLLMERTERLTTLMRLIDADRDERFGYAAQLANEFSRSRDSVWELLTLWIGWWRDLLLINGGSGALIANADHEAALLREAQDYSIAQVKGFIHSLQEAKRQLEQNASPRLVLEVLMLNIPKRRKGD